jgi:predicted ATPase
MSDVKPPFIRRVALRDYKSIRMCDVALGSLTLLVGLNGSGKSNFLDALRLISDALRTNLRDAVEQRGDVRHILRRGEDECRRFSIELTVAMPGQPEAVFSVTVLDSEGLPVIEEEVCRIHAPGASPLGYVVRSGHVDPTSLLLPASATQEPPRARSDQLYLHVASAYPGFGELYDHLRGMRFFGISPEEMRREATSLTPASELKWDGRGAASTLQRLVKHKPETKERIDEYLSLVLPVPAGATLSTDNTGILPSGGFIVEGPGEPFSGKPRSLCVVQNLGGKIHAFVPRNLSDGTLRAFGVLLSLFQAKDRPSNDPISVVGIEEPEASLHPAAASVLWDAMNEATGFTQVLGTTHSVELLDRKDVDAESLLAVEMVNGESRIGPVDRAGQSIMRDRLATAGELLRQNQLAIEPNGAKTGDAQAAHS